MRYAPLIAAAAALSLPWGEAAAQQPARASRVIALQLDSRGSKPEINDRVSAALRSIIDEHPAMTIAEERADTVDDLALAAGCTSGADVACLERFRQFVDAERILFGTVRGKGGGVYEIVLQLFDFASATDRLDRNTIELTEAEIVDEASLRAALLDVVYGDVGVVEIRAPQGTSGRFTIDGRREGPLPGAADRLALGPHVIVIEVDGGEPIERSIFLEPGEPWRYELTGQAGLDAPSIGADLDADSGSTSALVWVGGTLMVIGAAGLGAGYYFYRDYNSTLDDLDEDATLRDRCLGPNGNSLRPSCEPEDVNRIRQGLDDLEDAETFSTLGFAVGGGVFALGALLTTWGALSGSSSEPEAPLTVSASPSRGGGRVSIGWRF